MDLLTPEHRARLLANGQRAEQDVDYDPFPVVKLFTPDTGATWLLAWIEPDDHNIAFGLCDLGLGSPELGTVLLGELARLRGRFGCQATAGSDPLATRRTGPPGFVVDGVIWGAHTRRAVPRLSGGAARVGAKPSFLKL